jgi:hypothetical protein
MIKLHYFDNMKLHGDNAVKFHPFEKYDPKTDRNKPCMFWLYDEDSYKMLANHTGKKYVCWHGNDIKALAGTFVKYINIVRNPEITHVCLNYVLQGELFQLGIYAIHRYIFWADPDAYMPEENLTKDCFMCANKARGGEYGEMIMNSLAWKFPDWTFHIFGIEPTIPVYCDNVKYYGWIPEDEMDVLTKNFGLCFRYNIHDGFPQVMCKALLRNQFVITRLDYDGLTIVVKDVIELLQWFGAVNSWIEAGETNQKVDVKSMINNFDFIK